MTICQQNTSLTLPLIHIVTDGQCFTTLKPTRTARYRNPSIIPGLGTVKKFQDKKISKFWDIIQDTKPRTHSDKVPLRSSRNTVVT